MYQSLAVIYDRIMDDEGCVAYANHIEELLRYHNVPFHHILELGCGTGNITRELLKKGYEIVAVDTSSEMLEVANRKLSMFEDRIILLEQDIRSLELDIYEIDAVVMANDVINYLLEIEDVASLFQKLLDRLKEGGSLVFDISSAYKLKHVLADHVFGESFEDMVYLWENTFEEEQGLLYIDLNIMQYDESIDAYRRLYEEQIQRAYEWEDLRMLLKKTGFSSVKVFGDFTMVPPSAEAQRIFFICRK